MARPVQSKQREPMSRDRVLRTAIGLADTEGIGALTMRRLAQELGVEAMTLYHYVANKDEMLDGMVDLVAGEVELPDGGGDWKRATRRRALAAREVFVRHPWVVALWIRLRVGPRRIGYMDSALRTYREAGLSPEITERVFHAVENHIIGYTLQAEAFPLEDEDLAAAGQAFLRTLSTEDYPHLAEHIGQHLEKGTLDEGDFEFGLDLILDGVERLADEEAPAGVNPKRRSKKRLR